MIVIQYDRQSVTLVLEYLNIQKYSQSYVIGFPLNKDFSSFKNNLKSNCTKIIFQIDVDEIPHEVLVDYLPQLLSDNLWI